MHGIFQTSPSAVSLASHTNLSISASSKKPVTTFGDNGKLRCRSLSAFDMFADLFGPLWPTASHSWGPSHPISPCSALSIAHIAPGSVDAMMLPRRMHRRSKRPGCRANNRQPHHPPLLLMNKFRNTFIHFPCGFTCGGRCFGHLAPAGPTLLLRCGHPSTGSGGRLAQSKRPGVPARTS